MKTAALTGIGQFEIRETPAPRIVHDTDVLIRIRMVGVCGSDIHYYTTGRIGSQIVEYPFVIGHEAAGIVEKTGPKVTRVKPGDRIAIDPAVFCGDCDQCRTGREHTCRKLAFLGCPAQLEGALSEFIVIPETSCFAIPDTMTWEQAVLTEPLAIGIYSLKQSRLPQEANAAILGAGPIGLSVFHALKTRQINHIFVTEKIEERLAYAKSLNPTWCGNPDKEDVFTEISKREPLDLDRVYECTGDPDVIDLAVKLLKPGGILTIVGIPETDAVSFPIHELRRKEITIVNIRRQVHCTQEAIDLLASKAIIMDAMGTHHFKLDAIQAAFDLVSNYRDGVIKAMIEFE